MGVLAAIFHFPPSDLGDMDMEDLRFWAARAIEMNRSRTHG